MNWSKIGGCLAKALVMATAVHIVAKGIQFITAITYLQSILLSATVFFICLIVVAMIDKG